MSPWLLQLWCCIVHSVRHSSVSTVSINNANNCYLIHNGTFKNIKLLPASNLNDPSSGKGKSIPVQALRVPGGSGSQISWQSAHEGGKIVSSTHLPPLPSRKSYWYSFLLEAESTPGLCQLKKKLQWYHRESNLMCIGPCIILISEE